MAHILYLWVWLGSAPAGKSATSALKGLREMFTEISNLVAGTVCRGTYALDNLCAVRGRLPTCVFRSCFGVFQPRSTPAARS